MNLLDENIRHDQGEQLRKRHIKFRFLIHDLAHSGIQDPDILPLLHRIKHPTLFTHDRDYFKRELAHRAYGLAWLNVFDGEAALFTAVFSAIQSSTHTPGVGVKLFAFIPVG